jgi:hypothetical protein
LALRLLLTLALGLLAPAFARADAGMLYLSMPGETLQVDIPEGAGPPPIQLPARWYSISIDRSALVLGHVATTRLPDWTLSVRGTASSAAEPASVAELRSRPRHALAMSDSALLAFRPESEGSLGPSRFQAGRYPSALPVPVTLNDRWRASFKHSGERWTVMTESTRRKDGALLAGSMALVAIDPSGTRHVLVPPAHGMAFERQELMWIGALESSSRLDLLLKRTWITGEVDYVLRVGNVLGTANADSDRPQRLFSSGVDELEGTETHVAQPIGAHSGRFGAAAFEISEEAWNEAVAAATGPALPQLLFDRQLLLAGEKLRITVEYQPRLEARDGEASSSTVFREGPVLVKAHFRGRTQTLLQTRHLDGGPMRLQVDQVAGEAAVQASYWPHYNNFLMHYWVWNPAQGRFQRVARAQAQGC